MQARLEAAGSRLAAAKKKADQIAMRDAEAAARLKKKEEARVNKLIANCAAGAVNSVKQSLRRERKAASGAARARLQEAQEAAEIEALRLMPPSDTQGVTSTTAGLLAELKAVATNVVQTAPSLAAALAPLMKAPPATPPAAVGLYVDAVGKSYSQAYAGVAGESL